MVSPSIPHCSPPDDPEPFHRCPRCGRARTCHACNVEVEDQIDAGVLTEAEQQRFVELISYAHLK